MRHYGSSCRRESKSDSDPSLKMPVTRSNIRKKATPKMQQVSEEDKRIFHPEGIRGKDLNFVRCGND